MTSTASAERALAALGGQRALVREDWSAVEGLHVRTAIHVGATLERDGDYFGPVLNRTARLLGTGRGARILRSQTAAMLLEGALPAGVAVRDLGEHRLRDLAESEHVFAVVAPVATWLAEGAALDESAAVAEARAIAAPRESGTLR
ncbi:MAG: hypothetical protein ACREM2_03205 [Vulcanimicrobiaceae bacterium]